MNNELMINNIKELCKNKNITVTKLEENLGFSQGLIGRWKDKSPNLDRIIDIAEYFQISIDQLVGRTPILTDGFLAVVYNKTNTGVLNWKRMELRNKNIKIPKINSEYNEDEYCEVSYYSAFDTGFFIMHCFSQHNKSLNPKELYFYIQPTFESNLVKQGYLADQLMPLWALILSKSPDAPDDAKAESMKQKLMTPSMIEKIQIMSGY